MSADNTEKDKKEALKALRKSRKDQIKITSALAKDQKKHLEAIRNEVKQDAKTVPEVAAAIDLPTDKVLWFMSAMKKYGQVKEEGKDGYFYRYALVQGESEKLGDKV